MTYQTINKKLFFWTWSLSWAAFVGVLCASFFLIDIHTTLWYTSLLWILLPFMNLALIIGNITYRWNYREIKNRSPKIFLFDASINYLLFALAIISKLIEVEVLLYVALSINIVSSIVVKIYIRLKILNPNIDYKKGDMIFLSDKFTLHKIRTITELLILISGVVVVILCELDIIVKDPLILALSFLIGAPSLWGIADVLDKKMLRRRL